MVVYMHRCVSAWVCVHVCVRAFVCVSLCVCVRTSVVVPGVCCGVLYCTFVWASMYPLLHTSHGDSENSMSPKGRVLSSNLCYDMESLKDLGLSHCSGFHIGTRLC